jgi:hypothetical protein
MAISTRMTPNPDIAAPSMVVALPPREASILQRARQFGTKLLTPRPAVFRSAPTSRRRDLYQEIHRGAHACGPREIPMDDEEQVHGFDPLLRDELENIRVPIGGNARIATARTGYEPSLAMRLADLRNCPTTADVSPRRVHTSSGTLRCGTPFRRRKVIPSIFMRCIEAATMPIPSPAAIKFSRDREWVAIWPTRGLNPTA